MKEVLSQRQAADALRVELENARAEDETAGVEFEEALREIEAKTFALTPHEHGHTIEDWREKVLEKRDRERKARIARLETELTEATRAVAATLDGQKPLFGDRNAEPIVLLPVRLETRFEGGSTLKVRVFPDDVHVNGFDERLSPAELRAAEAYWRKPGDESWRRLLDRLGPGRAAWAKRATRPRAPHKPELRKAGERRPPRVTTLPTRWRFIGIFDGKVVVDEPGKEIPSPLPLGILAADEKAKDRKPAHWLIDYEAAVKVGMALTLTLPPEAKGLDELFVVGVQQSPAAEASRHLRDTLMGHTFGPGLAFLVPGTPTNNTPESRSAWSSLRSKQRPRLRVLKAETDASRLVRALGLPEPGFLGDCQGARDTTEQTLAGLTLLTWDALGRGMVDAFAGATLREGNPLPVDARAWSGVRDHLVGNVRSRGPLPTIRVGRQPYGVLPTTSLDEWAPGEADGPSAEVASWLLRLRHHWRAALVPGWIPRVTDAKPADEVAADILSRLPVAADLAVRRMLSPAQSKLKLLSAHKHGPPLSAAGIAPGANLRWTTPTEQISRLSYKGPNERPELSLVAANLDPKPGELRPVLEASAKQLRDALAYARGKLTAAEYEERWPLKIPRRKKAKGKKGNKAARKRPETLFALSVEHPGLLAALLDPRNGDSWEVGDLGERDPVRMAIGLTATVDELVTYELGPPAAIDREEQERALRDAKAGIRLAPKMVRALEALAATPADKLAPLALEVFDVYSHRLDAWITSLATRRLHALRKTGDTDQSRVGGYGWVENLRPSSADQERDLDGYIHAPSLQHAATAAVLRSGFKAHDGDTTLAVDLRSRRARVARWLLGGVRRGQDLGSLLGYRFERALHDSELDELIDDFRGRFPLQLAPEPEDGREEADAWKKSSEAIAARNVVDGLALARAWMAVAGDQAKVEAQFGAAAPAAAELADALDAVSDLMLAESVHHLVGGNPLRAGISADTLGRGEDLPDRFDVLRSPHRGRAITQRVAAILPAAVRIGGGWSSDALAKLEPRAEAWARDALGPAAARRLTGSFERDVEDKDGKRHTESKKFDVGADQLGLGALATAFAVSAADTSELAELVRGLKKEAGARVNFEGEGWRRLRGVASRVRDLLAAAQPLLPDHLAAGPAAAAIDADLEELRGRLREFVTTIPERGKETPGGRLAKLARAKGPLDSDWLKQVSAVLPEILGASLPLAPLLDGADLGPAPKRALPARLANWARRNGAVRPAVRTWHELLLLTGASSGKAPALTASQSPLKKDDAWIGGTFPAGRRPAARQGIVFHAPVSLGAGKLAGIVFDEWVEVLPGSDALAATKQPLKKGKEKEEEARIAPRESELTGLSFHYDRPDAKAPQALLVAVPPDPRRGWTGDTLALAVRDTLELAKLRAVDLGDLPLLTGVLPGIRATNQSPLWLRAFDYWKELAD